MIYRKLGNTGLMVSEVGLGGEWLARHSAEEVKAIIQRAEEYGMNIMDCFMAEPAVRSNIGAAIRGHREKWIIQGHIGSTWQDGQYKCEHDDVEQCRIAFEDLLTRLETDYIDLGMIHFIDRVDVIEKVAAGPIYEYIKQLKAEGKIRHIGLSTHNPDVLRRAVELDLIELCLFSLNPAYDMLPPTDNIDEYFADEYAEGLGGIDPARSELYKLCEQKGVALTVMKAYGGSRLFDEKRSPFGVALTPVQCIHYALTRPAVASVFTGFDEPAHVDAAAAYETATDEEKDYATVLAGAPSHAYGGACTYCSHCKPCPVDIDIAMVNKLYDLATMQDEIPTTVQEHYNDLEHKASECLGCGSCEERCPFAVGIVERMAKAAELLG